MHFDEKEGPTATRAGSRLRLAALLLGAACAGLLPRAAAAKPCGTIGGQRVPCACGDVLMSDVILANDPVAATVCPGNGLLVRAPRGSGGLTVDLAGKQLRGSGHGIGVWVIDGGAGGAAVISRGGHARIDGFMDGLVAHGLHTVALVANLSVHDSARDGVRIDARGYVVHDTEVLNAGRDGFSLGGNGFGVTATTALHSHRFGYFIRGRRGNIGRPGAGNTARDSGEAGFDVIGRAHHLVECAALGGGHDGIRLSGMGDTLVRCRAEGNAGTGIVGSGMHVMLAGNRATGNGDSGVLIHGADLRDGGGNRASANRNTHHPAGAAQCSISGVACGP